MERNVLGDVIGTPEDRLQTPLPGLGMDRIPSLGMLVKGFHQLVHQGVAQTTFLFRS